MMNNKMEELKIPRMGEAIFEVTIVKWLKKEGDSFSEDEPIVNIATDKVDSELSVEFSGVIWKYLASEGTNVQVGNAIALLKKTNRCSRTDLPQMHNTIERESKKPLQENNFSATSFGIIRDKKKCSPLVMSIAENNGIIDELKHIHTTGKGRYIQKNDIIAYMKRKNKDASLKTNPITGIDRSLTSMLNSLETGDIKVDLDGKRKIIADRMSYSHRSIPQVSSFVEGDVTNIVIIRMKFKKAFEEKYNIPLTYMPFFVWAIAKALKDYPSLNSWLHGDILVRKKSINIGIAVALHDNNLIVPVVKDADKLSIKDLAIQINKLATMARNDNLYHTDVMGATFSLSNIGVFDTLMGVPMVIPPQVGIVAIGAIKKKPEYRLQKTLPLTSLKENLDLEPRYKVIFSHSYDHRIIDGQVGGLFVKKVFEYLENFSEKV